MRALARVTKYSPNFYRFGGGGVPENKMPPIPSPNAVKELPHSPYYTYYDPKNPKNIHEFKKGDEAPTVLTEKALYPDDFEPWNFNYRRDGVFWGAFTFLFLCKFYHNKGYGMYEYEFLIVSGRNKRPDREYYQP